MRSILLTHASRYPRMTPADAVKLLYQSEFAGGHLISNEDACKTFLLREYAATPQSDTAPLLEDIGSGIFRVHLAALDAYGYTPEALCRDFIRSASIHRGTMSRFLEKLSILEALTAEEKMPFSGQELSSYLEAYTRQGCPAVSHSAGYRDTYHPAYRVISSCCLPEHILHCRTD